MELLKQQEIFIHLEHNVMDIVLPSLEANKWPTEGN